MNYIKQLNSFMRRAKESDLSKWAFLFYTDLFCKFNEANFTASITVPDSDFMDDFDTADKIENCRRELAAKGFITFTPDADVVTYAVTNLAG